MHGANMVTSPTALAIGVPTSPIRVRADCRWNPTGVLARPGETFAFRCWGEWRDAGHPCGPAGQPGFGAQKWAGWLKRHRSAPWFAAIGALGKTHESLFVIGEAATWTNETDRAAPLYAFANDAWFFYFNNEGEVALEITRVR